MSVVGGRDVRSEAVSMSVVARRRRPWWSGGDVPGGAIAMSVVERR